MKAVLAGQNAAAATMGKGIDNTDDL